MRNLFERLKPEHLQTLKDLEYLYPYTIPGIFEDLESNNFWFEFPYSFLFTLLNHLEIYDYSPTAIESLFEND